MDKNKTNTTKIIRILITIIVFMGIFLGYKSLEIKKETKNKNNNIEQIAVYKINNEDIEEINKQYLSKNDDESVILLKNKANLKLEEGTIIKSGNATNIENTRKYGTNSAVIIKEGSTATISKTNISTSSKGANALFLTDKSTKLNINDSNIKTTGNTSNGIKSIKDSYVKGKNIDILTTGKNSPAILSENSNINIESSNLKTEGLSSPLIYSKGAITLTDTKGESKDSKIAIIEGINDVTIENSELIASAKGTYNNIDNAAIMFYQINKSTATTKNATFSVKESTLTIDKNSKYYKTAPMFFITNTNAEINLTNTNLNFGSNTLISVKETDIWGNQGTSGGSLILNAKDQNLKGNIEVGSSSDININLVNSKLTSTINNDNKAKSISITLDNASVWNVTEDSYVTVLNDENETFTNIKTNGHIIYYDKNSNTNLKGNTFILPDGGKIMPME